jgi:hypothetical protein
MMRQGNMRSSHPGMRRGFILPATITVFPAVLSTAARAQSLDSCKLSIGTNLYGINRVWRNTEQPFVDMMKMCLAWSSSIGHVSLPQMTQRTRREYGIAGSPDACCSPESPTSNRLISHTRSNIPSI